MPCTPLLTRIGQETDNQESRSAGGMILYGKHLIKAWTKRQILVATSTAEAELYAGNRAATESMGVQAFANELGRSVPFRLHIDSNAALSVTSRKVLGKAKHIEILHLWFQEAVRSGKVTVEKIPTETISSDLGTKHLTSERSDGTRELLLCMRLWIRVWPTSCALAEVEGGVTGIHTYTVLRRSPSRPLVQYNTQSILAVHAVNEDVEYRTNLLCTRACRGVPPFGHDRIQ